MTLGLDGRLLQAGPRRDVFGRPSSPQVARLLGIYNLTAGTAIAADMLRTGTLLIKTSSGQVSAGTELLWSVRPEEVRIRPDGHYPATIVGIADLGAIVTAIVRLDGGPELRVRTTDTIELRAGDPRRVDLDPKTVSVWPR